MIKKTLLSFFCILSFFWAVAQNQQLTAKPRLYVLTIGVKDYRLPGLNLFYADKDAKEVATLFQKQTNLYDVRKVTILVNELATRTSIRNAFDDMQKRVSPQDLFVLFFSGHGIEKALIPYDYNEQDPESSVISQDYLTAKLNLMGCNSLILLDACHSGSFAKGKDVVTSAQRPISADAAIERLVQSLSSHDKMRLIIGSSASNRKSFECHECQNGYFAQGLIDAFDNLAFTDADGYAVKPDANNNGWLSPSELSTYLQDAIKFRTAQASIIDPDVEKQTVYKSEQTTTDAPFIFVGSNKIIPPPPPPPKDTDGDGYPDSSDDCPTEYCTNNNGCPIKNQNFTETHDGLGLEMVAIKGGTFQMGCTSEQQDCGSDEKTPNSNSHSVTLSNFYIGKYEVTQAQWKKIMGTNPSYFKDCDKCPVEQVSYKDIEVFLEKLNQKTRKIYSLPTEAQWEYVARGGGGESYQYIGSNTLKDVAWYSGNSSSKTHEVGGKTPNGYGLYDMSGNVWEWCKDWYDSSYYAKSDNRHNPENTTVGTYRVLRGGSWFNDPLDCRVAFRGNDTSTNRNSTCGFRLVLSGQ
jgi:formylglycine-generating enzyme required for sulfatase activity